MTQIIEFRDAYPHYNMDSMANNEPTATEKLIGMRSSLFYDTHRNNRVYQEWFLGDVIQDLLDFFLVEKEVKEFYINLKTGGKVNFVGTRRGDVICGVCQETHERVRFSRGFPIEIEK